MATATNAPTATPAAANLNGVPVDQLVATVNAVQANPSLAQFNFRLNNAWCGGSQNRSTVADFYGAGQQQSRTRPFILEADEPGVLLGKDTAANPVEYLLHALASCITTSMVFHAAARGIRIERVESTFEGDIDLRGFLELDKGVRQGFQGIRVNFKIKADVPQERLAEVLNLGSAHSPVFDSLAHGVPISLTAQSL